MTLDGNIAGSAGPGSEVTTRIVVVGDTGSVVTDAAGRLRSQSHPWQRQAEGEADLSERGGFSTAPLSFFERQ